MYIRSKNALHFFERGSKVAATCYVTLSKLFELSLKGGPKHWHFHLCKKEVEESFVGFLENCDDFRNFKQ